MKNYYKILDIKENASQKEIKKAYRQMALKYHPDKNNDNSQEFIKVGEAYKILSDLTKKQKYDLKLKEEREKQLVKKSGLEFRVINMKPIFSNLRAETSNLKVKYTHMTVQNNPLKVNYNHMNVVSNPVKKEK